MVKADNKSTIPIDPIYAAIERHRNAARLWAAAVAVRDAAFKDAANPVTLEQQRQLDEVVAEHRLPLIDEGLELIGTMPTTPQGLVAALEYARDLLMDGGATMPQAVPWLDLFVGTLADAAADLLAQQQESES